MRSVFHSVAPKTFIPERYSPMFVLLIDPSVDDLMSGFGVDFRSLMVAGSREHAPLVRYVLDNEIEHMNIEEFMSEKGDDLMKPAAGDENIPYPSRESADPRWYRKMVTTMLEKNMFADFDFCDFPYYALYVRTAESKQLSKQVIKRLIKWPTWMNEHVDHVKVVEIIVQKEGEAKAALGSVDVYDVGDRCCLGKNGTRVDDVTIRDVFRSNPSICENAKNVNITNEDLTEARRIAGKLKELIKFRVKEVTDGLKREEKKGRKVKNKVSQWMDKKRKKKQDSLRYRNIPAKKIRHVNVAAMILISGDFVEARKRYHYFAKSLHAGAEDLELFGRCMKVMCDFMIPNCSEKVDVKIGQLLGELQDRNASKQLIPLLVLWTEMSLAEGNLTRAVMIMKRVLDASLSFEKISEHTKGCWIGALTERLAGMAESDSAMYALTVKAQMVYEACGDEDHALRCAMWLDSALPRDRWRNLYQWQWLKRIRILQKMNRFQESLELCKKLVSCHDLDSSLHIPSVRELKEVTGMSVTDKNIEIPELFPVKWVRAIDGSFPEFWGYTERSFSEFTEDLASFGGQQQSRLEAYWNSDGENGVMKMSVKQFCLGCVFQVQVAISSHYTLSVEITDVVIHMQDENGAEDTNFEVEFVVQSAILPKPALTILTFNVKPLKTGKFTVNAVSFVCWRMAESRMCFEPVVFEVIREAPQVSMVMSKVTGPVFREDCRELTVTVRNDGVSPVENVSIFYKAQSCLCALELEHGWKRLNYTIMTSKLEPREQVSQKVIMFCREHGLQEISLVVTSGRVPLVFKKIYPPPVNNQRIPKFLQNIPYVFTSHRSIEVTVCCYRNVGDSGSVLLYVSFSARQEGIKVIGVMNSDGDLLKIHSPADDPPLLQKLERYSFLVKTSEKTDKRMEAWRCRVMNGKPYALLFSIESRNLYSQLNIPVSLPVIGTRVQFIMELFPGALLEVGMKAKCRLSVYGLKDGECIYVSSQRKTQTVVSLDSLDAATNESGYQWIGIRKVELSHESGFDAEFSMVATKEGCHRVGGLSWSVVGRSDSRPVDVYQFIRVVKKL